MVNLLADFIVRFNAGINKRATCIYVPYSHVTVKVVHILFDFNCIVSFSVTPNQKKNGLHIKIIPLYINNACVVKNLELMSKPGLRLYWSAHEFAKHFFRNSFQGFYIISTSRGLCTSTDLVLAHILQKPVAGEVLLKLNF
jgi:ribosomal protein S8